MRFPFVPTGHTAGSPTPGRLAGAQRAREVGSFARAPAPRPPQMNLQSLEMTPPPVAIGGTHPRAPLPGAHAPIIPVRGGPRETLEAEPHQNFPEVERIQPLENGLVARGLPVR